MMPIWENDKELFDLTKKELFTALLGDVMDKMGLLHQFLPAIIKPLSPAMVVIGRAMPVIEADITDETVETTGNVVLDKPFGRMFEALDDLKEDEVYICDGSSHNYALWGGLMSMRAMKLGAAGAVVNGYTRDTNEILRLGFPTFSIGTYAQDQGPRGRVIDYRVAIEWNGVRIHPGDIVFGDRDGVIVIPKDAEKEAFAGAFAKARGEKLVAQALRNGESAVSTFDKYGIM
jgi:regulator of RNase E activity RraA